MKIYILLAVVFITGCRPVPPVSYEAVSVSPIENKVYPIAIIGSGAAGTMAVKRAVLNNNEVLLFSGAVQERRHSRGNWVRRVDNVPGLERYERTINELSNETIADIMQGPFSSNLCMVQDSVCQIEKTDDLFRLTDGSGRIYHAKYVLLATGIMDEQPNIQGSIRPILNYSNGQTVAYCLVCDGHRCLGKNTAIIGYKEEAALGAIRLADLYQSPLALITNGHLPEFSESTFKKLKQRNIAVYTSPIYQVLGEPGQLAGFQLESDEVVPAEMGFVMLGIRPNNQLALQLGANVDERGLVLADQRGESSVPNLFIAGDLRSGSMKQIYTAWQNAVDSIQTITTRIYYDID